MDSTSTPAQKPQRKMSNKRPFRSRPILGLGFLLLIIIALVHSPKAQASSITVGCRAQGATITKNYFLYADWCGDNSKSYIMRCSRSGTSIWGCKSIASGYFRHANVLDGKWGSNYYWVLNSGRARKAGHQHWCLDIRSGQQVGAKNCDILPDYKAESGSSLNQGMAQYGRFYLRGYSGNNRIDVYEGNNRINRLWVGQNWEELEDVAVDGDTGDIYFTTGYYDGGQRLSLYHYNGYKLPPFSHLDKTVKYNLNGLSASLSYSEQKVEYAKKTTPPKITMKNDYQIFKHWSSSPKGGQFDFNTPIKEDLTLYAIFELRKYEVSFITDESISSAAESESITHGDTASSPKLTFNDENYYLKGWSTSPGGGLFSFSTPIKKDTKLYAVYGNRCDEMTDSVRQIVCPGYTPGSANDGIVAANGDDLIPIIQNAVYVFIGLSSLVAVIFIIVGGAKYLTSAGNPDKTTAARRTVIYAIIGLIICALAFSITNWVIASFLN